MKTLYLLLACVSLCLGISGCATYSSGSPIDETKIESIERGTTTKSELIAWFGQPTQVTSIGNGKQVLYWQYYQSKVSRSPIPFIGGAKADTQNSALAVTIDASGVVEDYQWTKGHY